MPLRVAAISFLNPAPLLYNFEHPPAAEELRARYLVHYTTPARCAAELHSGAADLGLIPIAELTPDLAVVPGCTVAAQTEVRSILLLVRQRREQPLAAALSGLKTIATDSASRSSVAYLRVLLERFYGVRPRTVECLADPLTMLSGHEAALLIGDPALLAREHRPAIDAAVMSTWGENLLWLDLAQLWRAHTGLPWVAAVWAVRPQTLSPAATSAAQLVTDLNHSRDAGLAHVEQLVFEWTSRLAVAPETIRAYLSHNIYYILDPPCLEAIRTFRRYAAELDILPPLPEIRLLTA